MALKAHIVWNSDRSEGVIFVDDPVRLPGVQTAAQDAEQAATGNVSATASSALGEAFAEFYSDDECPTYVVDADALYALCEAP